jgi:hypothetical protein
MDPKRPLTARNNILVDAIQKVHTEKEELYGDPAINLACAGELKRIFFKYAARSQRRISPGEHEAIDQALTRIARMATSSNTILSAYSGAAGYLALAAELALMATGQSRIVNPTAQTQPPEETQAQVPGRVPEVPADEEEEEPIPPAPSDPDEDWDTRPQ